MKRNFNGSGEKDPEELFGLDEEKVNRQAEPSGHEQMCHAIPGV